MDQVLSRRHADPTVQGRCVPDSVRKSVPNGSADPRLYLLWTARHCCGRRQWQVGTAQLHASSPHGQRGLEGVQGVRKGSGEGSFWCYSWSGGAEVPR